ncbi:FAR1 DNA binding domain, Zinc finger, SWIM-type, MULE transposase domain, FHY3/FAR1 family [Artemisia annua]|uniref:FAR1 DNA binding domain, Zinc finger, SWIM-type, MULE transposase domain, FHY3/FAR1 family n=1 Tax=Artemisia annua TaxID=35608 RepID=A0A2U1LMB6_ARTAN|nr:FAR1 DNA binding domain, Zinc finger, SWIM-type, MULE transposase domain, FHY3/FAR1 family [Artemisia annua]
MVDIVDIVHDSNAEDDIVVQEQNDQTLLLTEQDLIMDNEHHPQDENNGYNVVVFLVTSYVALNQLDGAINCSCGHYNRHGYLCRHVFCVFGIHGTENIPQNYINPRWRKNVLPAHLREKRHMYGPCIEETEILASKLTSTLEECIELIRNDPEKLSALLTKIQELKKETGADIPPQAEPQNKDALYEDLLGVKRPDVIDIENPIICNTKGNQKGHSRIKKVVEEENIEEDEDIYEDENVDVDDEDDEDDYSDEE